MEKIREALAQILATREVPEEWKVANIVMLFEKGTKDKPGYYRLVNIIDATR